MRRTKERKDIKYRNDIELGPMGFEPITFALSTQHSNQLSQDPSLKGFEPSTTALSTQHSHRMSYDPDLDVESKVKNWGEASYPFLGLSWARPRGL